MAKENECIETLVKATDNVEKLGARIGRVATIKNGLAYVAGPSTIMAIPLALCDKYGPHLVVYTTVAVISTIAAWICGKKIKKDVKRMTDLGKAAYRGTLEEQVSTYQVGK